MNPDDFLQLLRRAQRGEPEAVERLLTTYRPYLEALARPYADPTRADESVSDLVQDASTRAWQRLGQFQGADTGDEALPRFRDWLGEIVRSVGLNHRRDAQRDKRRPPGPLQPLGVGAADSRDGASVDPPDGRASPSSNVRDEEQRARVRAAVADIPDEKDREVTRLFFLEELTLHEIARRLGLTYDQARACKHRGKEWLAKTLGDAV